MKARFTNIDIVAAVQELQANLVGLRVTNVYDVDHKSYLFKFAKPESKVVLLIESGIRIHTTDYEWPKNASPSGFSMKLRKHIRNRRLEEINQVGVDRIVDMKFGSREAAYHVILELYDRGNIILTDHEYNVLNILRPRTDQDTDVRYVVHEKYPMEVAKQWVELSGEKEIRTWFSEVKGKEQLKKILASHLFFGAALVEHGLLAAGLTGSQKVGKDVNLEPLIPKVIDALKVSETIYKDASHVTSKGYIVCKEQPAIVTTEAQPIIYDEFHSFRFAQLKDAQVIEKPSFLNAVDEFFSNIEKQRVDVSIMEQQKLALKKLENVHRDHERRLDALRRTQDKERLQALLIEQNVDLVDKIIVYMRTLMAAKLSWPDVAELLERRRERGDEVAEHVLKADIASNSVTILLENRRYEGSDDEEDDETKDDIIRVDIDLSQSAFQNVSRLHTVKKQAAAKEMKTVEASETALKNAEKKTKQALKDVATIGTITKARKTHWFEKFFWFISSEKLLVIGGRDAQQNEMLVKKYLKTHDFYVHADLHGASSVLVKNPTGEAPPPKTLNEAAVMAIAYSNSWEAKVPSRAWWVFSHQVSKTAPSGEYLGTGSFMIRGKKNFLPPLTMVYGFGFIFRIDDESVKNRDSQVTDGKDGESAVTDANAGDEEDVMLEVDDNDDEPEVAPVEGSKPDTEASYPDTEESGAFLKSLVSKIISSGGDAEENTVIGATPSGYTPKAPTQKPKPSEALPDKNAKTDNTGKNNVKPNTQNQKKTEVDNKEPLNSDEEDWASYKKKGKKNTRPSKSYAQKHEGHQGHQGLPAKPAKKSKKGGKDEPSLQPEVVEKAEDPKPETSEPDAAQSQVTDEDSEEPVDKPADNEQTEDPVQDIAKENMDEDDDEDVATPLLEDVQTLRSLVGNPLLSDNILYGVPLCAPYAAMQDYKIKVKLLPGTTKRGKAAKTCFQVFLKEKGLTNPEKDVLKSVKDQDLSRNFPGSVKIAVQQQKFKQKKK